MRKKNHDIFITLIFVYLEVKNTYLQHHVVHIIERVFIRSFFNVNEIYCHFGLPRVYPGSLTSLYVPTFYVTPVDFFIILECNLYISCVMSCGNKIAFNYYIKFIYAWKSTTKCIHAQLIAWNVRLISDVSNIYTDTLIYTDKWCV